VNVNNVFTWLLTSLFSCVWRFICSPYNDRCKNLHDPRLESCPHNNEVLEHKTKATKSGAIIPDRLYHHQRNSNGQSNPLISSHIWEKCRPNHHLSDDDTKMNIWADTYALVCIQKPVARGTGDREGPGEGSSDMATTAANSLRVGGGIALTEVQRLSIVLMMHRGLNGSKHLDFTYAHNECKSCCCICCTFLQAYCVCSLGNSTNGKYSTLISI
jgi:hypothetical protein